MSDSVLGRVLRQCRSAMLGGTPVVYIKTASELLIRSLAAEEQNPLVLLLAGDATGSTMGRPLYELIRAGRNVRVTPSYALNYSDRLPDIKGMVTQKYPHLWTFRMPEPNPQNGAEVDKVFRVLEQYVLAHEDPSFPTYDILQSSVIVLYSEQVTLSPMLRTYMEIVDVEYPDQEEIRNLVVAETGGEAGKPENSAALSQLCTSFLGFSNEEIRMTVRRIQAVSSLQNSKETQKILNERKRQKMEGGILEQASANGHIGGMSRFQKWLEKQKEPLEDANFYSREIGTPPPKGVLLCGIPGCGKSEAARFTARTMGLPLLRLDIGSVMDKYQGESERKMRDALRLAEAMSPCVLWIDELEKGFSGASSGDEASFKRMFGYLLSWMQDNRKPCFIFATANDIGGLPKEFFRSGRFDALYAVYLPTARECADIFKVCMRRAEENAAGARHCDPKDFSLFRKACFDDSLFLEITDSLAGQNRPRIVVGSDIQGMVNLALRKLIREKGGGLIGKDMWRSALLEAAAESTVFGSGEENVNSIAVSYCRMLRKGFVPTSDQVLFRAEDYRAENLERWEELSRAPADRLTGKEKEEREQSLRDAEILARRTPESEAAYDRAVYDFLHERINQVAAQVERFEKSKMIR